MKSTVRLLAVLALMGSSGMALATDFETVDAVADDWSGGYLGLHAGYGSVDNEITDVDGFSNNPAGTTIDNDDHGFVFGGLIGYNVQFENIVMGLEADGAAGNLEASTNIDPVELGTAVTDYGFIATIRGRLGFAVDALHLFATAGVAIADVKNELTDTDAGVFDPDDSFSDDDTRFGWVAGGGAEWMFAENWIGRAEALYFDFGEESYFVDTAATNSQYDVDNTALVARIAIVKMFGD